MKISKQKIFLITNLLLTLGLLLSPQISKADWHWEKHYLGTLQSALSDLILVDIDNNGADDLVASGYTYSKNSANPDKFLAIGEIAWFKAPKKITEAWTKITISTFADYPGYVAAADINQDNHLDILATAAPEALVWFQAPANPENGTWLKHVINDTLLYPSNIGIANIDGDNDLDLVCAAGSEVSWFECPVDPTQTWAKHIINNALGLPVWVQVGLINPDPRPDVVVSDYLNNNIVWFENPEDPVNDPWNSQIIESNIIGCGHMKIYDLDSDSDNDLVVVSYDEAAIYWYESPTLIKHIISTNSPLGPGYLDIGDFDLDNNPDLVTTGDSLNMVLWEKAPENPADDWQTNLDIDNNLLGAWQLSVGQISSDCAPELVAAGYFTGDLYWYKLTNSVPVKTKDLVLCVFSLVFIAVFLQNLTRKSKAS